MSEAQSDRNMVRSVVAVVAGALTGVVLSLGTDVVLHKAGVFPPWGQPAGDGPLLLATAYRAVFGVLGGYITARLAPNRPMRHALILGAFGTLAGIAGAVATWNKGPEFGAHWYPVALVVLGMPQSWLGGKLRELQLGGGV
jgi:peptidoglycan/LPS O-acetylase OafA/YrhL